MKSNYFVSYDLNKQGQDYSSPISEIQSFKHWAKVQQSFWYVRSDLTIDQVFSRLRAKIDHNDSLMVVNASANNAKWYGVPDKIGKYLSDAWNTV